MELKNYQKRCWAEIDLNKIENNFKKIKGNVCCVVKADAYGHGAVEISKFYEKLGCFYFAVATIEEAVELRKGGISKPILILGYTNPACAKMLSLYHLTQCVYSLEYAEALNLEAKKVNCKILCHLKIDTGMGRIGFQYHGSSNELEYAYKACTLSNLNFEGIFMHFAMSDEGINEYTINQYNYFCEAIKYLESKGITFKIKHAQNSGGIVNYKNLPFTMSRAGIILYGFNINDSNDFEEALSLKAIVSHVKEINKGDSVSYGREFVANKKTRVATLSIGYADGFNRHNFGSYVIINGEKCNILGRVCMDQIMVESNTAKMGDAATIYGEGIAIKDVAKYNKTIPYEILCSISRRVPRVYLYNGKIESIVDYFDKK